MSTRNHYDEDFKRTLVELYHNGKTQSSLIKEYGVFPSALTKWIKQYSTVETDSGEVLTAKQVKELQKCMAQLEEENQILKKSDCPIHATLKQRLDAVHKLRFQHSIKLLCKVLRVNRSTYYKHFSMKIAPRTKKNQEIATTILKIVADYDKRVGAYKITHILERDYGIKISPGRVYRLIKTLNLPRMSTQKPVLKYHSEDHMEYHNYLHQAFNPKSPNMIWASDLTYIKVNGTWYYLCIIMDLFSRKIIAWNLSSKPNAELVTTTFQKAYTNRNSPQGLMFHSDRGTQYTAMSFRKLLDALGVVQSFSKKGYPFDNACCESFFKYLKNEECHRRNYHTKKELELSIFQYIEGFYNSKRPHGSLGLMSPNEKEKEYWSK